MPRKSKTSHIKKLLKKRRKTGLKPEVKSTRNDVLIMEKIKEGFILDLVDEFFPDSAGNNLPSLSFSGERVSGLKIEVSIEGKVILFSFHFKESSPVPYTIGLSNANAVNITVGSLDTEEKRNLFRNSFIKLAPTYKKGFRNESRVIDLAKEIAAQKNLTLITSNYLDNHKVDFMLKYNFSDKKLYFQVKSSKFGTKEEIYFRDEPIHYVIANKNLSDDEIINQISKHLLVKSA